MVWNAFCEDLALSASELKTRVEFEELRDKTDLE